MGNNALSDHTKAETLPGNLWMLKVQRSLIRKCNKQMKRQQFNTPIIWCRGTSKSQDLLVVVSCTPVWEVVFASSCHVDKMSSKVKSHMHSRAEEQTRSSSEIRQQGFWEQSIHKRTKPCKEALNFVVGHSMDFTWCEEFLAPWQTTQRYSSLDGTGRPRKDILLPLGLRDISARACPSSQKEGSRTCPFHTWLSME